jgi:hypothetical protein
MCHSDFEYVEIGKQGTTGEVGSFAGVLSVGPINLPSIVLVRVVVYDLTHVIREHSMD